MGTYVLPESNHLENALRDWMSRRQQEKQSEEARKEREAGREERGREREEDRTTRERERKEDRGFLEKDAATRRQQLMADAEELKKNGKVAAMAAFLSKLDPPAQQAYFDAMDPNFKALVQEIMPDPSAYLNSPAWADAEKRRLEKEKLDADYKRALINQANSGPKPVKPVNPDVVGNDAAIKQADAALTQLDIQEREAIETYMADPKNKGIPFTKANVPPNIQRIRDQKKRLMGQRSLVMQDRARKLSSKTTSTPAQSRPAPLPDPLGLRK